MNEKKVKAFVLGGKEIGGWFVGDWRVQKPVLDATKCVRCWLCEGFCPEVAISKSSEGPVFDMRFCKGCGICDNECPTKAIFMKKETER